MGGDDDAARNGGESAKGTEGTRSAYIGLEQTAGVVQRSGATGNLLRTPARNSLPACPCPKP